MAEEQNKEKPRIALIKHKKEDVSSPSVAAETEGKKKVVIVKKKVLVKKASPKPSDLSVPQTESPPEETPHWCSHFHLHFFGPGGSSPP